MTPHIVLHFCLKFESYVKLLAEGGVQLVMHEEKLSGDELEVGQRAVPQHQQHLIGGQPAAGGIAPAPPGETQRQRLASNAFKNYQARIGTLTVVILGVEIMAGGW